jgi:hypothetical protein
VTQAVRLRSVTWFGGHPGAFELSPDDAAYRSDYGIVLFEEAGNGPAATPFREIWASVLRVPTGAYSQTGAHWFSYSAEVEDVLLAAGAYWLSVVYLGNNSDWLWGASSSGQGCCFLRVGSRPWQRFEAGGNRAFTLYGMPG